jgi:hypothetical protein
VIEQVIERLSEGTGEKLLRRIDRKIVWRGMNYLVAGHSALSCSVDRPTLRHEHDRSNISGDFLYILVRLQHWLARIRDA